MSLDRRSDTLALATRLRRLDDAALCDALVARDIAPTGIDDFFDLAEAFLEDSSIQRALTTLGRDSLMLLAVVGESGTASAEEVVLRFAAAGRASTVEAIDRRAARSAARLLIDVEAGRYTEYHKVTAQLHNWPTLGLPDLRSLASAVRPNVRAASDADIHAADRLAAERAFTATTAIAELLIELEREPAKELSKGGLTAPDGKRLTRVMGIDADAVAAALVLAESANLVCQQAGCWQITEAGSKFLLHSADQRWLEIALAWLAQLPEELRLLLRRAPATRWDADLRAYLHWLYPAGGDWAENWAAESLRGAQLFGIVAGHTPSHPGLHLLGGDPDAARAAMAGLFPAAVEQVYLQHDLSVVAPGPLSPRIDARLRSLANAEGRTLASSYRISTSTINRAMAAGDTAESILEFLSEVSLTAIPQPLHYLIAESSARFGMLRVGKTSAPASGEVEAGLSYVRSDNELLLGTLLVDQALAALGLRQVEHNRIVSRFDAHTVFWALSDAHYPVAAENDRCEIIPSRRVHPVRATGVDPKKAIRDMVERLRLDDETQPSDTGQAWLARQLAAAVHDRAAIIVSVAMPSGSVAEFHLEPTGVAGGRLRARDPRSAIERTLPLSSIVSFARAG